MIREERVIIVKKDDVYELSSQIIMYLDHIKLPKQAISNIKWQLASREIRSTDTIIKKVNEMLRPWRFAFYASRGYSKTGILVYDFVRI